MLSNGEIIDNTYQIIQMIGSGGTGSVYLAYHLRLEKYVVVKKIKDNFVGRINVRTEVDILKQLKHTYLPQVYDFIQRGNQVYTVMDYIEGNDLESYIKAGCQIEEERLLKWLRQLCEVLVYLHGQTPPIIHSDIKPANIMITEKDNVCLIDFNVSLDGDDSSQISGITLPYASPEQYTKAYLFMGHQEYRYIQLDGRSDMYSLGAVFYHLITGTAPANPYEQMVPLSCWTLPYGEGISMIIDKAMQLSIEDRYENMEQMLQAVLTIRKHTREYKKYLLGTLSTIFLYVGVMGLGIWLIVQGYFLTVSEKFEEKQAQFFSCYQGEDYLNMQNIGFEILNNGQYMEMLEKNADMQIQIFHAMGESFFAEEDYEDAVRYYQKAIEGISDIAAYGIYYRDYIVALVRDDRMQEAEAELEVIRNAGIADKDINYVQSELLVHNQLYTEALELIDSILKSELDQRSRIHLLVLAGDSAAAVSNYEKQIAYLEQAEELESSIGVLRKLGNAYMQTGSQPGIKERDESAYYVMAKQCYIKITEKSYATLNDNLNLAICYRALKEYENSINLLKKLERENRDYRISMNLAFAYEKMGDAVNASKYTNEGLMMYQNTPEEQREPKGSDNIQRLEELRRKYF